MLESETLKPCPFCGGKAEHREYVPDSYEPFGLVVEHSEECFLSFAPKVDDELYPAWNTRASHITPQATPEGVELLATAQRNLRHYINCATWKCSADKEAALGCIDVYDEDFAKMSVRLVNALADTHPTASKDATPAPQVLEDPFAWTEGVGWHKPAHRAVMACVKLGGWMSAALGDPNVSEAMKADINEWFSAGEPMEKLGQALNYYREQAEALQADNERLTKLLGEARDGLVVADEAIREMFRYYDGGETRGSYDGRPERNQLRKAGDKTRTTLARLSEKEEG